MISNVTALFIYKLFLIYFDYFYFTSIISISEILATRVLKYISYVRFFFPTARPLLLDNLIIVVQVSYVTVYAIASRNLSSWPTSLI